MSVAFDVADRVATIAIDRPEAKNAMDAPTASAMRDAVERIEGDPDVRVGILTGRGGVFCAGIVEPGTALAEAQTMAARIAVNGPLGIACSKRVMADAPDWPASELFERQFEITAPVFASADAKEGARAFAEKRAPVWRGA